MGKTYIRDGVDLQGVGSDAYDFVMASHNLEHYANPLKAFGEFRRVVKPCGFVVIVVPWKMNTFDRNRPTTSIEHLVTEFRADVPETMLSHIDEAVAYHVLEKDRGVREHGANAEQMRDYFFKRSVDNFNMRGLHQHVFSFELLECIGYAFRMDVKVMQLEMPHHQLVVYQKPAGGGGVCK